MLGPKLAMKSFQAKPGLIEIFLTRTDRAAMSFLLLNGGNGSICKFIPILLRNSNLSRSLNFSMNVMESKQSRLLSLGNPGKGMKEKIRSLYKQYGKIGVLTYFTISTSSFLTIYMLLKNGVDLSVIAEKAGLDRERFRNGGALIVALGLNKILFPARIGLSFLLTPKIARLFGKA